mmetsp:Transcript_29854/g.66963  ORF Transcript_29854/g.66963 Transcript_29854/m.66963 type:complete len:208 (-) Transcript_29854:109-732(-)
MFLTPTEADFGRRLVFAVFMGGVVGWERRSADRAAGIRTMALVSLGSCLFTICSFRAFLTGPMAWDASRIAAAIPSGVGFLGAGMIWKQSQEDGGQTVHGLTTAASLWLSAAVGIAAGGEMYFCAMFGTSVMVLMLRFGPRVTDPEAEEETCEDDLEEAGGDAAGRLDGSFGLNYRHLNPQSPPLVRSPSRSDLHGSASKDLNRLGY